MKHGIAPLVLASQVSSTAAWALDPNEPGASATSAAETVRDATRIDGVWRSDPGNLDYLRLLLSAHYLTVGTFCPTDVDARIRHHVWLEIDDPAHLSRAVDEIDRVAALDPRLVSARVLTDARAEAEGAGRAATYSGHDGEWFSVRAGALGRALALGDDAREIAERIEAQIEDELAREAAMFDARVRDGEATPALSAATILAHNVGDLSRVVEAWPKKPDARAGSSTSVIEKLEAVRQRYARLGHAPDRSRFGGAFFVAGAVNKAVMAIENHRFLALRAARALRASRALLLPIGPFFHGWGMTVARSLEEEERADVLAALLETHLSRGEQTGVLRAICGIADAGVGSWDKLVAHIPARLRKIASVGPVQAAIKTTEAAFLGRIENKYRAALRDAELARDGARSVR